MKSPKDAEQPGLFSTTPFTNIMASAEEQPVKKFLTKENKWKLRRFVGDTWMEIIENVSGIDGDTSGSFWEVKESYFTWSNGFELPISEGDNIMGYLNKQVSKRQAKLVTVTEDCVTPKMLEKIIRPIVFANKEFCREDMKKSQDSGCGILTLIEEEYGIIFSNQVDLVFNMVQEILDEEHIV